MRINHNIAALNTYRQLTGNTGAAGKSLEKLSSGLRINRAGDDAAGLAISEKMRGQIRGLEQAQRNAQDSISLIQTAEGALNETHSILQRMKELATQAANDTYSEADRSEIQKEINQLTSEINRIANTTEFNTKKLLNGELGIGTGQKLAAGGSAPAYVGTSLSGVAVAANATANAGTYEAKIENLGAKDSYDVGSNTALNGASNGQVNGTNANGITEGAYKVTVTSENAATKSNEALATGIASAKDITVTANATIADATGYKIEIGKNTTHDVTTVNTAGLSNIALDATATPADGVYAIKTAAEVTTTDKAGGTASTAITGIKIDENSTFAATGLGATIKVVATANPDEYTLQLVNDSGGANTVVGSTTFTTAPTAGVTSVRIGDFTMNVDFKDLYTNGATYDGKEISLAIKDTVSITNLSDPTKTAKVDVTTGSNSFALTGGGTFTLDAAAAITRGQTINVTVSTKTDYTVQLKDSAGTAIAGSNAVTLTQAQLTTSNKNVSLGNGVLVNLDAVALTNASDGTFNTTFDKATAATQTAVLQNMDGTDVTAKYTLDTTAGSTTLDLGATGLKFAYTGTTVTSGDFLFTIDKSKTADDFRLTLTRTLDDSGAVDGTKLIDQQKVDPNGTVDLGGGVTVKTAVNMADGSKATYKIETGDVDNSLGMQVGANQGQSFSMHVSDMRAKALGITGAKGTDGTVTGSKFTNQTADITNGTNNIGIENALDVSSHTSASGAIKVLDNAINAVSAERSRLGAYQNRLEHTINNLGTSSENLTAAESRIRDVDMAKEMMEFTKNNILTQAAQAMLAQANQQPQGVLQLLR